MDHQTDYFQMQLPAPTIYLTKVFADIKTMQKDNLNDLPAESRDDRAEEEIKGLKFIAKKIKILLQKNKRIQYNQASRILINNFASEEKTKRNIKRRVYDAINVLVSAGVVDKDDNKIELKHQKHHNQRSNNYYKSEQDRSQILNEKESRIEEKRKFVKQLQSKLKLLNSIYKKQAGKAKKDTCGVEIGVIQWQRQVSGLKISSKKKKVDIEIKGGKRISQLSQLKAYLCNKTTKCKI